jgi:hypothetical protein
MYTKERTKVSSVSTGGLSCTVLEEQNRDRRKMFIVYNLGSQSNDGYKAREKC